MRRIPNGHPTIVHLLVFPVPLMLGQLCESHAVVGRSPEVTKLPANETLDAFPAYCSVVAEYTFVCFVISEKCRVLVAHLGKVHQIFVILSGQICFETKRGFLHPERCTCGIGIFQSKRTKPRIFCVVCVVEETIDCPRHSVRICTVESLPCRVWLISVSKELTAKANLKI